MKLLSLLIFIFVCVAGGGGGGYYFCFLKGVVSQNASKFKQ